MPPTFFIAVLAVFVGGVCIAVQAPINARLAGFLGDPVAAAAASFLVGFLVLFAITGGRGAVPSLGAMAAAPWWAWVGGALGAVYVWAAVWSVGTLGVVTMVAALILGQLVAALVLDAVGAFGVETREISLTRIAAVVFVGIGVVLSRL